MDTIRHCREKIEEAKAKATSAQNDEAAEFYVQLARLYELELAAHLRRMPPPKRDQALALARGAIAL
ncbi:hypothetical protein LK12_12125 [Novosphingobium malaysiense]|uniref:Uncharacterized protein n=2 Tax=Novosphingobium malaysiense TaxID=1348853 RepID=A0A0B1ZQN4_9SPHN|nr:hypothetical protein LK12_12125 [Novosphingobium malaysiense]